MIRVPAAALLLAAVCELAAMLLAHVPMLRNRSDELAEAVQSDHAAHRIVLLGDSVTRDSTARYALGRDADEVINLSTHGALGLAGEYFLLQRYLEAHSPPQYVVISISPEVYFGFAATEKMHYYMWYTFDRPSEHAFLKRYLHDIDRRDHYPAVLDPQERIMERFYGLIRRSRPTLSEAVTFPDPNRALEPGIENLADQQAIARRVHGDDAVPIRSLEAAALAELCRLSVKYRFQIRVVWPPAPPAVESGLEAEGVYRSLESEITRIFEENGGETSYFNMNSVRAYMSFHRDAMHIYGEGWEERAASDLRDYLGKLPDRQPRTADSPSTAASF